MKKMILIMLPVCLAIGLVACSSENGPNEGLTVGNMQNTAFAAQQGAWVYYATYEKPISSNEDAIGLGKGIIYKQKNDGTKKVAIYECKNEISNLQIKGDWIYFDELYNELDGSHFDIYRIKTDGRDKKKLAADSGHSVLYKGKIYYTSNIELVDDEYYSLKSDGISVMNLDGSHKRVLIKEDCYLLGVDDGWLYYGPLLEAEDDNTTIYKMKQDGKERTKVLDIAYDLPHILIDKGEIFAVKGDSFCKMIDLVAFKIWDKIVGDFYMDIEDHPLFNKRGEWIYYGYENILYKEKGNGTDKETVNKFDKDLIIVSLVLLEDNIVCRTYNDRDFDSTIETHFLRYDGKEIGDLSSYEIAEPKENEINWKTIVTDGISFNIPEDLIGGKSYEDKCAYHYNSDLDKDHYNFSFDFIKEDKKQFENPSNTVVQEYKARKDRFLIEQFDMGKEERQKEMERIKTQDVTIDGIKGKRIVEDYEFDEIWVKYKGELYRFMFSTERGISEEISRKTLESIRFK